MKWVWAKKKDKNGRYIPGSGHFVEATKASKPRIHVRGDIDTLESPITGEVIHTRPQYEAHLRQFGCHVAEPGDVSKREPVSRRDIDRDVKRSLQQLGVVG